MSGPKRPLLFFSIGVGVGVCFGVALGALPAFMAKRSTAAVPGEGAPKTVLPSASPTITPEDLETRGAQQRMSNLLACREERARKTCASGPAWACDLARKAILGDGVFDRLRALKDDRRAQSYTAELALNACLLPEDDPRQEGIAALLAASLEPNR